MFQSPWVCNCDHAWSDYQQVALVSEILRHDDIVTSHVQFFTFVAAVRITCLLIAAARMCACPGMQHLCLVRCVLCWKSNAMFIQLDCV